MSFPFSLELQRPAWETTSRQRGHAAATQLIVIHRKKKKIYFKFGLFSVKLFIHKTNHKSWHFYLPKYARLLKTGFWLIVALHRHLTWKYILNWKLGFSFRLTNMTRRNLAWHLMLNSMVLGHWLLAECTVSFKLLMHINNSCRKTLSRSSGWILF